MDKPDVIQPHSGIILAIKRNEVLIICCIMNIFDFWGCHIKVPETGRLNRNLLSHSFGGWKSEIRVLAGLAASEGCEGKSFPCLSSSFWQPQAFCGLQMVFFLCLDLIFPLSVSISVSKFPLFMRTQSLDQGPPQLMTSSLLDICRDPNFK